MQKSFISSIIRSGALRRVSAEQDPYGAYAGWVYFAIKIISNKIASAQFDVFLKKNENLEKTTDHALYNILYQPNPLMDGSQLFSLIVIYLKLFGSAPLFVIRDKYRNVKGLFPMRPDLVHTKQKDDGTIAYYEFRLMNKTERFEVGDVLYLRDPDPRDPVKGFGALSAVALEVDVDASAALWNKVYMDNHGEPAGVLETDHSLTEEVYNRLIKAWNERHAGSTNAGKFAILEAGLKWRATSTHPKEGGYIETRKMTKSMILNIFGIPEGFFAKDVTFANAEVMERALVTYTIDPMLQMIINHLNYNLVPEVDQNAWIGYAPLVKEDKEHKLNTHKAGVGVWLTVNEVRAEYNLPPVEGGDKIETSNTSNTTTINLSKNEEQILTKITARQNKNKQVIKNIAKRIQCKKAIKSLIKQKKEQKTTVIRLTKSMPKISKKVLSERKVFLKKSDERIGKYKKVMNDFFVEQSKEIEKIITKSKTQKSDEDVIGTINEFFKNNVPLATLIAEQYEIDLSLGVAAISSLLGKKPVDIMKENLTVDFLKKAPLKSAGEINETTREQITSVLSDMIEAELYNRDDAIEAVQKITGDDAYYRAERIARTEVGRAQNFARLMEMKALGVKKKMWMSVFRNTRPSHKSAHGQVVGIDEKFRVGGHDCMTPNDDMLPAKETVNCQCSISIIEE